MNKHAKEIKHPVKNKGTVSYNTNDTSAPENRIKSMLLSDKFRPINTNKKVKESSNNSLLIDRTEADDFVEIAEKGQNDQGNDHGQVNVKPMKIEKVKPLKIKNNDNSSFKDTKFVDQVVERPDEDNQSDENQTEVYINMNDMERLAKSPFENWNQRNNRNYTFKSRYSKERQHEVFTQSNSNIVMDMSNNQNYQDTSYFMPKEQEKVEENTKLRKQDEKVKNKTRNKPKIDFSSSKWKDDSSDDQLVNLDDDIEMIEEVNKSKQSKVILEGKASNYNSLTISI